MAGSVSVFYVAQVCERFGRLKMAARPHKIPRGQEIRKPPEFYNACTAEL